MRYLTKSRFKLAMECITKLYYTQREDYADESIDDPFIEALAEGGFQVGELAKFLFCDDPVGQKITVDTRDYDESLKETAKKLEEENAVIAEAAFSFQSLFARADIIVKHGEIIDLYEVKSKSTVGDDLDFITRRGTRRIITAWIPYLYDVAFQKYVLTKALATQNITVRANLILVDKSKKSTVDGLNQKFKILKTESGTKIEFEPGLTKQALGDPILKVQNIDEVIQRIWDEFTVPNDFNKDMKFIDFVNFCAELYLKDTRVYTPLGRKCKYCQFINLNPEANAKKSGFHECWKNKTGYGDDLLNKSLVVDLWCGFMGRRNVVQELINKGKYLLETVSEQDIAPVEQRRSHVGLSPHERRMEQISRVQNNTEDSYFNIDGLKKEIASWIYPLHMITFYTLKPALPFEKDCPPYREVAFQFSHHTIEKNGDVSHCGQFLSFQPGVDPMYELSYKLSLQFNKVKGTVFGYQNYRWDIPYRKEGIVDLHKLVQKYYVPFTKGNTSLRTTLSAVIQESDFLKNKYSKPIYGRSKQVNSLNFEGHVWIDPAYGMDPYKTLPRLFEDYDTDRLDKSFGGFSGLAYGGAARTAYSYLQFSDIPVDQREKLKEGLLKYCELDTLAMAMILEGWFNR